MKQLPILILSAFLTTITNAQYFNNSTTLNSGTYTNVGWASGATITIAAGANVNFTGSNAFGSGNLIVNGTLNSVSMQVQGAATVANGGVLNINGTLTTVGGGTLASGSTTTVTNLTTNGIGITVAGQLNVNNSTSINNGGFNITPAGVVNTANITFNGANTINGSLTVSNTLTINNVGITMACPGQIMAANFTNNNTNTIAGRGYIRITSMFNGSNPLTSSANIVLNRSGAGGNGNSGSATLGTTSPCVLPVNFGPIEASISQNNTLNVSWSTVSEKNNDHFRVEVSKDGNEFVQAGSNIPSKSADGNSTMQLNYAASFSLGGFAASTVMGLLLFTPLLLRNKKRGKITTLMMALIFVGLGLYSCTKEKSEIDTSIESIFVRIVQVDLDGTEKKTQVIKAIRQ